MSTNPLSPALQGSIPAPRKHSGCGVAVLILVALVVAAGWWAWRLTGLHGDGIPVRISSTQLQAGLERAFPVDKKELFLTIQLSDPSVALSSADGDRIGFGTSVGVAAGRRKLANGTLTAAGKLRYDSNTGTFYLDEPEIKDLKIDRVPSGLAMSVRKAVTFVLNKVVKHLPVYQLDTTDPVQRYAKGAIKSVTVTDGEVVVRVGRVQ